MKSGELNVASWRPVAPKTSSPGFLAVNQPTWFSLQLQARPQPDATVAPVDIVSAALVELEQRGTSDLLFHSLTDMDSTLRSRIIQSSMTALQTDVNDQPNLVKILYFLIQIYPLNTANEVEHYCLIIEQLKKQTPTTVALWAKIYSALDLNLVAEQRADLIAIHHGIVKNPAFLPELAALYDFAPYPKVEVLAKELHKTANTLKHFIDTYDADPFGARAPRYDEVNQLVQSRAQIIAEQSNIIPAKQLISEVRHCLKDKNLSATLCFDLGQQLTYVNALALEHSLVFKGKHYAPLMNLKRQQLITLSEELIKHLRTPGLGHHAKQKAQLNLLAVLRELYFRSTGLYLSARQLVLILLSLYQPDSHLLLELGGDDNHRITPLLAVMQWALALGNTVDVCVANRTVLAQTSAEQNFFNSLNIPYAQIHADSTKKTYQEGGINYSTLPDLALYRMQQASASKQEGLQQHHLILDGTYQTHVNFKAVYAISRPIDTVLDKYLWVYPLINEFIVQQEPASMQTDSTTQAKLLKNYLSEHPNPSVAEQLMLDELSDEHFNRWCESAYKAAQLVEGKDFIIVCDKATGYVTAQPIHASNVQGMSDDFIFGEGVQQLLHARLQQYYPHLKFEIIAELESEELVASNRFLLDSYRSNGRVIGLSEHLDVPSILAMHDNLFTLENAYRLSPHALQQERFNSLINTNVADKINHLLARVQDSQPIIIIGKDAHHARWLHQQLNQQMIKDGLIKPCALLTGDEPDHERKQWLNEHAGTSQAITVVTPSLINSSDFTTRHNKGFYVIQPYFDSKSKFKKILAKTCTARQKGQYALIYEDEGRCVSHLWSYKTAQEKRHILKEFGLIAHRKNQQQAARLHDMGVVAPIHSAILAQFQEWQALYSLVCTAEEYRQNICELIKKKECLVQEIESIWQQQQAEEQENEHVLYDDRQIDLVAYEEKIEALWLKQKEYFKDKIQSKIDVGSVNYLRLNYLDEVSFKEQVRLKQIAAASHAALARKERKKRAEHSEQGFEIHGAMLRYSDAKASQFSPGFISQQLNGLRRKLIHDITYSGLPKSTRTLLIVDAEQANSLLAFELVLKLYGQRLDTINVLEKYRLQPLVAQLCTIYTWANLMPSPSLHELKKLYYNNSTKELMHSLDLALSWAKPENQGFGFWLERSAVKSAAADILKAIAGVKAAQKPAQRQEAIKCLYRMLCHHQAQLDGLWIFSFGHKNVRELIKQTLALMDDLVILADGDVKLNQQFIHECQEDAQKELMQEQFWLCVMALEKKHGSALISNNYWLTMKQELRAVTENNKTVYSLDELYCLLVDISSRTELQNTPLIPHLVHLRGVLRNLWNTLSHEHQDLACRSRYFAYQETHINKQLNNLADCAVQRVALTNNRYNQSIELIVEGEVDINNPLFANFVRYKGQTTALEARRETINAHYLAQKKHHAELSHFAQHSLPGLRLNKTTLIDEQPGGSPIALPLSLVPLVAEIDALNKVYLKDPTVNVTQFTPELQAQLDDRQSLKSFSVETLTLCDIAKLNNELLKEHLTELYNKIHVPKAPKKLMGSIWSYLSYKEGVDDWSYQLLSIIAEGDLQLEKELQQQIETKIAQLEKELLARTAVVEQEIKVSEEKLHFIDSQIAEEDQKGFTLVRTFEERGEFYQFLNEVNQLQPQPAPFIIDELDSIDNDAESDQTEEDSLIDNSLSNTL